MGHRLTDATDPRTRSVTTRRCILGRLRRWQGQQVVVEVQRRLLGLVAVGDKASEQMDDEVERTAVAGMLDLADILELIDDRLDERAARASRRAP